ncbi:glycosyltransferase family 2 protein [Glaciimonas sp. PCH181]|uniref:glycosyltransferase family 2 protein n=1 Tax=Glaciimonas sp. PCH181 TaxID=2133943 RepID=UPI000D3B3C73|nr:glycosyltransferase family 2 protein [Glaciimonas sp. PCH181]PUA20526.1 hypothetical protein C7W93_12480 [Glaciimonas sp. PCH181]
MTHICAIIVTYEPDINILNKLLSTISHQVNLLVIVNNGGKLPHVNEIICTEIICNQTNLGLAVAQNQGIEWAKNNKASHILILDQDSEPEPNMVCKLYEAEKKLLNLGKNVAAVGPVCIDRASLTINPFYKLNQFRFKKLYAPDFDQYTEATFLISSGQLLRMDILMIIGNMKDELFIDYIDIEWGLRALSLGYKSYGVFDAKMFHSVGDGALEARGKRYPMHSPTRAYYMARNAILLYKSLKYPINWVLADSLVTIRRIILIVLFCKPRIKYISSVLSGITHGIIGKSGGR